MHRMRKFQNKNIYSFLFLFGYFVRKWQKLLIYTRLLHYFLDQTQFNINMGLITLYYGEHVIKKLNEVAQVYKKDDDLTFFMSTVQAKESNISIFMSLNVHHWPEIHVISLENSLHFSSFRGYIWNIGNYSVRRKMNLKTDYSSTVTA